MNDAPSRIYLNDGAGKFTQGWTGTINQRVLAFDVNGDGKPDLVEATGAGFSVLLNTFADRIGASHVYHFGDAGGKVAGTTGADTIYGGAGGDTVDGGAGLDTMVVAGSRAGYVVARNDAGITLTAGGVADSLANVERIRFSDGALAFDVDGVAGQTYRLYQAAFGRTPDVGGLSSWLGVMDAGYLNLNSLAAEFVKSVEFKDQYKNALTNQAIVEQFYRNVLHREGEAAGVAAWTSVLDHQFDTVAGVLASFADGGENKAALVGVLQNGIAYTPAG
jgi:Ca2+-binding RTX toxin-like protein